MIFDNNQHAKDYTILCWNRVGIGVYNKDVTSPYMASLAYTHLCTVLLAHVLLRETVSLRRTLIANRYLTT